MFSHCVPILFSHESRDACSMRTSTMFVFKQCLLEDINNHASCTIDEINFLNFNMLFLKMMLQNFYMFILGMKGRVFG